MFSIFNELSADFILSTECSHDKAREVITDFVRLMSKLIKIEGFQKIVTTHDISSFKLLNEYGINEWLGDPYVERKYKDVFRRLINSKCNYIDRNDYLLEELEVEVEGKAYKGIGCLLANKNDDRTISIASHQVWQSELIKGTSIRLNEDSQEFEKENVEIHNIFNDDQIINLTQEVFSENLLRITSGQDLWEQRELLFPNLIFCDSIRSELYDTPQKYHLIQVINKLLRLQEYFSRYNGKLDLDVLGFNARTESETVKTDPKLKNMRKFKLPNGEEEYFFLHIGFSGNYCGRIHFLPRDSDNMCYIGYIGPHLPTKKHS